ETVYKECEDRMERAVTTASSLVAEQDSGNTNRTQSMATLNESFPQGTGSSSGPSSVQYALTVNPTIYTTCIEQFWTFAKVKRVNGEQQVQALVDKKKNWKDMGYEILLKSSTFLIKLISHPNGNFSSIPYCNALVLRLHPGMNLVALWHLLSYKKLRRKQRKDSAPTEPTTEEHVSTPSFDPPPSGEDRTQLAELMSLCTNLQEKVLDLEKTKTAQAKEITSLKKRVKQLEKRRKSRTSGLRRLRKGRKIKDLDADAEVTVVNVTQVINDDNPMFDIGVLEEQEIEFEKVVEEPVVSVATTTKSIPVSTAEVVTTASAITSIRSRAKGIIFHDQEEQVPASTKIFSSSQSQLPQVKDKSKGKMVEPEVPLKNKDQVALDEEMARNLQSQLQAKLIEEERFARKRKKKLT
ncbi:hypothetical protein Tco_0392955, partial [Tanacetum coccineum]